MSLADVGQVSVTNFIVNSRASKEALKSANILKSLNINVLIEGPKGVGKETLARYIANEAPVLKDNLLEIENLPKNSQSVIILNIQECKNLHLLEAISKKFRIIATSNSATKSEIVEKIFPIKIYLPPLKERKEDILPLAEKFLDEVKNSFSSNIDLDLDSIDFDLSENGDSIKKEVYFHFFIKNIKESQIIECLEKYFEEKIGTKNDYKEFLYLYEVPLIKAGFKKFKSQLKMAEMFGLNRNTLRKKINENKDRL